MNYTLRSLILAFAILISGCVDTAQWTEEVKLHDGTMIQVERKISRNKSGFPNSSRGSIINSELTYKPLNVYWSGKGNQNLTSFEIFDGVAYLTIFNDARDFCNRNKAGTFKATFLKYENLSWVSIDQSNFPTNKALKNLYKRYWGHSAKTDAKGLITWSQKAVEDGFNSEKPKTVNDWYKNSNRMCGYEKILMNKEI